MEPAGCRYNRATALSRCSQCNSADLHRVSVEAVRPLVDAKVLQKVQRFWQCGGCQKVFWVGPKSDNAIRYIRDLLDKQSGDLTSWQGML